MTTQFDLTDDQHAIQEMARKFTADAITPHAAKWDEDHHYRPNLASARFMCPKSRAESGLADSNQH
jgi:alkylation response protein AidB-like acyl-CoA dehydrogenase